MILIYTENWDGKFKKLSYEIVSYGAALAKKLNTQATVLSIGKVAEENLKELGNYGADKILSVDTDFEVLDNKVFTDIIAQVAEKIDAKIFVFSNNNTGRAIAPRIAARFKAGIVSAVEDLPKETEPFTLRKKVFTGKGYADVVIKSEYKVITLFQNSFGVHTTDNNAVIEKIDVNIPEATTKLIERKKAEAGKILLTDAEIVVSGGRGMKGPENWGPLEEFAKLLNAATGCSRPVADEGWRPHEEHVGQTGKVIAPNVYFALGISGAVQHIGGVSGAKYIVAVNIDKDAPIFEVADYGIVGDVHKILPEMIEAVKKIKQQ